MSDPDSADPNAARCAALEQGHLSAAQADSVLTLERLRSPLVGPLALGASDPPPAASEFAATLTGALDALQNMKQADDGREPAQESAKDIGQAQSQEVMAKMVENIAHDQRLLDPIKAVIQNLAPALLQLARVDARFFRDKQHPARRLLQEITQRSLAYDSVSARGFSDFLAPLQQAVGALAGTQMGDAQPFEQVLQSLMQIWDARTVPGQLENAVKALEHAEARNAMAQAIAREISASPDARKIPAGVLDFLCGPWSQVLAQAHMADTTGADDPGHYRELMFALMWSARIELTHKNTSKLTRLLPRLLGKLREGLELIGYPSVKTSAFFDLLMKLHQQAFKPLPPQAESPVPAGLPPNLQASHELWVDPVEAKASGFMELPDVLTPAPLPVAPARANKSHLLAANAASADVQTEAMSDLALPLGAWVEWLLNGHWVRTQLSWASPNGNLFLFTSTYGNTQSMTRRTRDKLFTSGQMRLLAGQPLIDGALDAVANAPTRNF